MNHLSVDACRRDVERSALFRVLLFALFCVIVSGTPAGAEDIDVLARARQAATSGRRADALAALAAHLEGSPRDIDARLLYGLILSWEGRYDDARRELSRVLDQSPTYTDARVALMNVEWWSGRSDRARAVAEQILSRDSGNEPARIVRDRLDAAARPWSTGFTYSNDSFSDERDEWHEYALSLTRRTSRGSIILRASEASRFGRGDRMVELEAYPRIRPGTYAFVGLGAAPDATLYPSNRQVVDLYQSVGRGFEVSGGVRRLEFDTTTYIYVGTLSKYLGNWMLTGKVFRVPRDGALDSTSYHAGFRRYTGGDGASYVGVNYSHGLSREEIRNVADLATLESDTIRAEINRQFLRRLRIHVTVSTSRQERQDRQPLWQTSLSSGMMVLF